MASVTSLVIFLAAVYFVFILIAYIPGFSSPTRRSTRQRSNRQHNHGNCQVCDDIKREMLQMLELLSEAHDHWITLDGRQWLAKVRGLLGNRGTFPRTGGQSVKTDLGNARLIAKAPEMLEALKEIAKGRRANAYPEDIARALLREIEGYKT